MPSFFALAKQYLPARLVKVLRLLTHIDLYELIPGPMTYSQDGMATSHNADFLRDPRFARAYQAGEATGSWGQGRTVNQWRAYVQCWAAAHAQRLPGDFVECGVYKGGYARANIEYLDFNRLGKKYFLLDTFNGLAENYVSEQERQRGLLQAYSLYEECYAAVHHTFAPYPNVVIVRGAVPETLPQVTTAQVCFLSIDMNNAAPEVAAAEYFWDRLVPGAVMLLDDYGHRLHAVQKREMDAFAARQGVQILTLPTAQGLILKP